MTQELQNEIEHVFRSAERIWDSQKYGDLKTLWDEEDAEEGRTKGADEGGKGRAREDPTTI